MARDQLRFIRRHQAVRLQIVPVEAEPGGFREPQHGLQITQPPWAFFDVRFEIQRDIVVPRMARALLIDLRVEKFRNRARFFQRRDELFNQRLIAPYTTCFEKAGRDGDIFFRFLDTFSNGAHRNAGLESRVPQQADESFHHTGWRVGPGGVGIGQHHDNIHVGGREQEASSIAANRHDCRIRRHADIVGNAHDRVIDDGCMLLKIVIGSCAPMIGNFQRGALASQPIADMFGVGDAGGDVSGGFCGHAN